MGDLSDHADIARFMRSREGKAQLQNIRRMLKDKTIVDVSFTNEVSVVATTLRLSDGSTFFVGQPSLTVEALRKQFHAVLEREYYRDFPERRPSHRHRG